jgi:hypothetical protein
MFHLQSDVANLKMKAACFYRDIGIHLQYYNMSQPGEPHYILDLPLRKSQILQMKDSLSRVYASGSLVMPWYRIRQVDLVGKNREKWTLNHLNYSYPTIIIINGGCFFIISFRV